MEKTKPYVRKNVPDKSLTRAAIKSNTESAPSLALTRRRFLGSVSGVTAVTLATGAAGLTTLLAPAQAGAAVFIPQNPQQRRTSARLTRLQAAQFSFTQELSVQTDNGEENDYGGKRIANYSKGLPHNGLGEVDPAAYNQLLHALATGRNDDFEAIPLGGVRPLRNPQAGLAFDLEGPDAQHGAIRPAPRIDGAENSAEAAELYWMALARDVNFSDYASHPLPLAAAADLSGFSDFRGPKAGGVVTPATLFRGNTPDDLNGPYISQFLLKDIPYGSLTVSQRQQTVVPGVDYVTSLADWVHIQNGGLSGSDSFDSTPRYIRSGRDIGQYVHVDALYEAYLNACLLLLGMGAPFDPGNPYTHMKKQDAFGTFGGPHILSLVTEVATRALKAVWFEKWFVHRRLRPEAFGGLVHNRRTGAANYPIQSEILNSAALVATFSRHGTYLLPQAYPEGSPLHPSYGAGHATVAGACVTILKAWFDEAFVIPDPVVPSADGLSLVPYVGPPLTVGGELNKVASNIASGRNFAGIHWRTDYSESVKLGEAIAIGVLEEQRATYNESASFTLMKFDGTSITI
ncbi:MAG: vanadium-dependent haloperoxidase [Candidatus Acidiferrales bacterium]